MSIKELLSQVNQDVKDIFGKSIETTTAYVVPSRDDPGLTFPLGSDKKGKTIKTCVLMVDVRNSTKISKSLSKDKIRLGKIYSAFIHAMATIADEYGYVRNIVGDRVMVVFEPKNCYVNALNCAEVMNTVATRILATHVGIDDFKVGIGIDFGEMLVLKTGIRKKHDEQSEYKSLVWVGDAANIASKLTDVATKKIETQKYKVRHEPRRRYVIRLGGSNSLPPSRYLPAQDSIFTKEQIADKLFVNSDGKGFGLSAGIIHKIEKLDLETRTIPNILMTESVYSELSKSNRSELYNASGTLLYTEIRDHEFKDVSGRVFGGDVYYTHIEEILK
ncbi:MAG: adenylate/guanylate cyclase domain-containing protein [Cyclobacteriaceae bacterium]|nr:adenylate/guanylate cyclase domain-containing protein [Cyclobacteriaceae bacterium]